MRLYSRRSKSWQNTNGIVLDEKGQEQPADKDRAQKADKTQPGHMPLQPDEPLKEKSGL
jgi:hypothetical protein